MHGLFLADRGDAPQDRGHPGCSRGVPERSRPGSLPAPSRESATDHGSHFRAGIRGVPLSGRPRRFEREARPLPAPRHIRHPLDEHHDDLFRAVFRLSRRFRAGRGPVLLLSAVDHRNPRRLLRGISHPPAGVARSDPQGRVDGHPDRRRNSFRLLLQRGHARLGQHPPLFRYGRHARHFWSSSAATSRFRRGKGFPGE